MFEDLNKRIRIQNLQKIKQIHDKIQDNQANMGDNQQEQYEDNDEYSLSDLDVELEEREKNFNRIMAIPDNSQDDQFFIKRNDSLYTPPSFLRKIKNQLQLSYEKLKLQEDSHQKQITRIEDMHKRQKQFFFCEINKLKLELSRQKRYRQDTKILRKQNNNLLQLNEQLTKQCQHYQSNIKKFQCQIDCLETKLNHFETHQLQNRENYKSGNNQNQIRKQIEKLQEEMNHWKNRYEKKENMCEKQNLQIKQLQDQLRSEKDIHYTLLESTKNQFEAKIEAMARQIQNLHKRNRHLQEVFFEKLTQITKLQATFFTNNQSNTTNIHRESLEETINLQEESPIRISKQERMSIERIRRNRVLSTQQNINNPERRQDINKRQDQEQQDLQRMNQRLKQKLSYANKKLMELLNDKIENEKKILQLTKKKH